MDSGSHVVHQQISSLCGVAVRGGVPGVVRGPRSTGLCVARVVCGCRVL